MSWTLFVMVCCLLLLAFLIWVEARRQNRLRLTFRIVASLLMTAALAAIALPLTYQKSSLKENGKVAVIITRGYSTDSLKQFLSQFEKPPAVFSAGSDLKLPPSISYAIIDDPDSLHTIFQNCQPVHVFGWGFTPAEAAQAGHGDFIFHPAKTASGITAVHWTGTLKKGDDLVVQGRFQNTTKKPVKLSLGGLQATLDSVLIGAATDTAFSLSTVPKFAGNALYELTALAGTDTIEKERLPVQVDSSTEIRILMLASSPDFENKFLKSWLSTHGYEVDVRTRISTNKFNRLTVNADKGATQTITASFLQRFDLLLSDPASLSLLQPAEYQTISNQVSQKGLGLIIRADSLLPRSFYAASFPLVQTHDSAERTLPLYINDVVTDTAEWITEEPLFIRPQPETQSLVESNKSGSVVSSALSGRGKVVLSTLNNTYSWLLAGKEKRYAGFWSLLIRKAIRQRDETAAWSFSPVLPVAGGPVKVRLEKGMTPPGDRISGIPVAYAQDARTLFEWQARFWPHAGWQTAGNGQDAARWFVYDARDWMPLQAAEQLQHTAALLGTRNTIKAGPNERQDMVRVPVPKIYFFIIFLLAASGLWIEKKLM